MPDITIQSLEGSAFQAYLSLPPGRHGPGLILIKGLFNNDGAIASLCDSYAKDGFVVVAPNIFHRQQECVPLDACDEPDWERALRLYKNFDVEGGVRDLLATLAHMRRMSACNGKFGTVGYCLGCRLAFLMAARSDVDCTVGFYGVGIDSLLDEAMDIRNPFMLHLGDNDKLMQPSARQKIMREAEKNPAMTTHLYAGAEHGFVRESSPSFHPAHAALANQRTRAFLTEHLMR